MIKAAASLVLDQLLALPNGKLHNPVPSLLTKGMTMKLMHMFSIGVATVGITCLVGYASAANTAPGNLISDSMLVAQGTAAPGGTGSGSAGGMGMGSGNTGAGMPSGSTDPSKGPGGTFPEKARPGMGMDTGPGGTTGSNSGRTGTSSGSPGSSTGPTGGSGSPGMSGSGSGSSSGAGSGGK